MRSRMCGYDAWGRREDLGMSAVEGMVDRLWTDEQRKEKGCGGRRVSQSVTTHGGDGGNCPRSAVLSMPQQTSCHSAGDDMHTVT